MQTLFGLPTAQIALFLGLLTLAALAGIAVLALHGRILLRLGARNLPRRPLRSLIIIVGLALSTVVIATAFATGDALTLTLRSLITGSLGQVDEVVTASHVDFTQLSSHDLSQLASGSLPAEAAGYFPMGAYTNLRNAVRGSHAIAGLTPAILEQVAAVDSQAQTARSDVGLLGIPSDGTPGFPPFKISQGTNDSQRSTLTVAQLGAGKVYLNAAAASALGTSAGRLLRVYLPPPPGAASRQSQATAGSAQGPVESDFRVQAVVANGALGGTQPTIFLPLAVLQQRLGRPGAINEILVVNRGGGASVNQSVAATLDLRKLLVDRDAAETLREALASDGGHSVLSLLSHRASGRAKAALLDLQRTADRGQVTDHLLYLLGDPVVAAALHSAAASLPTRDGRAWRTLRRLNHLSVIEVKQGALNQADDYGSVLTSIFLVLGLFSIAAGVLLVFLIFVMLAAERQTEMGMARAVGMRRWQLVQAFSFEGVCYDLASTALGVGVGIGVSAIIIALVARTLASYGIPVEGGVQLRSVVIAFCVGLLVTFATVVFSAWRISRFNIVAAIHGLPAGDRGEVTGKRAPHWSWRWWGGALFPIICSLFPIAAGYALMFLGRELQQYLLFALGVSLLIGGCALLLRRLLFWLRLAPLAGRLPGSLAGLGLIVFWALPPSFFDGHGEHLLVGGMETFSLAGIMMVFGAVLLAAYNLADPLRLVLRGLGRLRSLAPAVRIAIAYPLQHRFRTAMTVAMFSLVVFTMIVSALLLASARLAYIARQQLPTGYDIQATAPATAKLDNIKQALGDAKTIKASVFAGVGSEASFTGDVIEPLAADVAWQPLSINLADRGFVQSTPLRLSARARGYPTDASVWQAMASQPGAALIARGSLPVSADAANGGISQPLASATSFAPMSIWVRDQAGGKASHLTILGVVDDAGALSSGLLTLASNVVTPSAVEAVPQSFFFKVQPGQSVDQAALGLQLAFGAKGLQLQVVGENVRTAQDVSGLLNYVLEGFVGMGLIAGMAALAVISTRAVVERRQQIGMLRAIGMRRRLVQLSFLLEASFTAWIGIAAGVLLGFLLANNVVDFLAQRVPELRLAVPWSEIIAIAALAYAASLAATLVAAWQAGRIRPAEALRYE